MVNRVLREDPSKGDMHNRQPITPTLLWKSMSDYDMWPLYAIGIVWQIPGTPPKEYLTLTLRRSGFSVLLTNVLSIPPMAIGIVTILGITYFSERVKQRALAGIITQLWSVPFLIYLYCVDITEINRWKAWVILTLLLSSPSRKCHFPG